MDSMRHFLFGEWKELPPDLPLDEARSVFESRAMAERLKKFSSISVDDVISLLDRVGTRLTSPGPYRDRIMDTMPDVTGFSPSMIEIGIDVLKGLLSRGSLEERLSCLGDRRVLDCWTESGGSPIRAVPLGCICHIAAGNIFLGSIDSLVMGMITKNLNVLKISRQDPIFPFIFLEALLEEDRGGKISSSIAITSWSHSNEGIMDLVGRRFDGILLFGGEEAVRSYRAVASPGTEVLAFGPKISWGLIREGLSEEELDEAIKGFAMDVSLWEQRACTSCQNLFVEGRDLVDRVAEKLHEELSSLEESIPQDRLSIDDAVDILREREQAFWDQVHGNKKLFQGLGHTVVLGQGARLLPSPLNRTVFVSAIRDIGELAKGDIPDMGYYMSTVGLAVPDVLLDETIEVLQKLGVRRFCLPGTMGLGADGKASHDGVHLALSLVRLINREDISRDGLGLNWVSKDRRTELLLGRLNRVLSEAMKAPFYREKYRDLSLPLKNLSAFAELPCVEKSDLEKNCYPSKNMLTDPDLGGYVFSSGGTSGRPRLLRWTSSEFRKSAEALGRGFRVLGIGRDDVVANLMVAGSLYTGFLAVNGGLEETGCTVLSMTANQSPKDTVDLLLELSPTVVMAMTSTLVELAEEALKRGGLHLDRIFYTGETMGKSSIALLEKAFSPSRVGSLSYGAVEIGPLAFQCPHCRHDEFHVDESWVYVEIDDDGELYATTLERTLQPIVRYRLGDRAEWIGEPCDCGRKAPRFRLMGRSDDSVRLLYNDLYLKDLDDTVSLFSGLSPIYQVVVEDGSKGPDVAIAVEGDDCSIEEEFLQILKEKSSQFDHLSDFGCPVKLSVVPGGTIERLGRTGKVRRIVDRRSR